MPLCISDNDDDDEMKTQHQPGAAKNILETTGQDANNFPEETWVMEDGRDPSCFQDYEI